MYLIAVIIFLISSYYFLKKCREKKYLQGVPAPPANVILGHITQVASTTDLDAISRIFKYGQTVKLRFGPAICPVRELLASMDYKFIEFILSSNTILRKSEIYQFLENWLGNGLLLSDGEYWKRHRKILTPAFHFAILKDFVEIFEKVGNVFIEKLGQCKETDSIDLQPLVSLYTLDVICETAMGIKLNVQSGQNSQYVHSVKDMCRIAATRVLSPLKIFKATYIFSRDYFKEKNHLKSLHGFTKDVMDSKKENNTKQKSKRMAFLDLLLKFSENENVLTKSEIQEEVDTFMFEGHDTTASGISYTLYCILEHPEVQEKILQEQKELFGEDKNPEVTYADLQNMKYLENVIKESLRLYPPVPVIGRRTTDEEQFDNYLIPKNMNIVLVIYALHRNPEYFPQPETFIPQRFETIDGTLPYAYIPFSAGSRNCIGQKFAMLEIKSIVSKIVRHFEIKPTTPRCELKLAFDIVLKSVNGVNVVLKKRR